MSAKASKKRVRADENRQRLGELLVSQGILARTDVDKALRLQGDIGGRLGTNLLELGLISEEALLRVLGGLRQTLTLSREELEDVPERVLRLIPPKLAKRYRIVPVELDGDTLLIAAMDPSDVVVLEEVQSLTACLVRVAIALEVRVLNALERYYRIHCPVRLTALARRLERTAARDANGDADGERSTIAVPSPVLPATPAEEAPPPPASGGERSTVAVPSPVRSARPAESAPPSPPGGERSTVAVPSPSRSARPAESAPPSPPGGERPTIAVPAPVLPATSAEPSPPSPPSGERSTVAVPSPSAERPAPPVRPATAPAQEPPPAEPPAQELPPPADEPSSVRATQEVTAEDVARLFEQIVPGSTADLESEEKETVAAASSSLAASSRGRRRRKPPPRFIELDDTDRALLYAREQGLEETTPEERLAICAEALQKAEIRDEIGDYALDFCAPYLARRLLLIWRKKHLLGWRGEGAGLSFIAVRGIEIPEDEPSVFQRLEDGMAVWRGPLPPFPAHQSLLVALDGAPREALVLPLTVRERVIGYLYGDNVDQELGDVPVDVLRRLVKKAAVAFEVIILKNKIRML